MKPPNDVSLHCLRKYFSDLSRRWLICGTLSLGIGFSHLTPMAAQYRPGEPSFFEDGEEQLDREIQRLNRDRDEDSTLLTIDDPASEWLQVTSPEGRFAVLMPGTPTVQQQPEILVTEAANLALIGVTLNQENRGYLVAYADYPEGVALANADILLSQVQEAIVVGGGWESIDDRATIVNGYPGREIRLRSPNGITTFRFYLIHGRLYLLGLEQTGGVPEGNTRFFDSFQPLGDRP